MNRYRFLDVLRGFAMLGIFPGNLPFFALPIAHAERDTGGIWDMIGGHATTMFIEHKFITLFCVLFGVGIYLLRQRAENRGQRSLRFMLRRLGGIFLFGVLHTVVLWFGDILWYYAVFGLLVTFCFRWPVKRMLRVSVVLLAITPAVLVVEAFVLPPQPPSEPSSEDIAAQVALVNAPLNEFVAGLEFGTPEFETTLFREGGYIRPMIYRVYISIIHAPMMAMFMGSRILGLMLLGMALAKSRWFLEPSRYPSRFRRMALLGLGLGVLFHLISFVAPLAGASPAARLVEYLTLYLGSLTLATGYAGVVGLLCTRVRFAKRLDPLEAAGRTALTNYICQSVIGVALFYSYGLGLYGSLDRGQLWLVVFAVWAVLLFASGMCLRHFRQGPLEWVLRRITYGGRRRGVGRTQDWVISGA